MLTTEAGADKKKAGLVVVDVEGQKAGLFVDDLLAQQQGGIKSLGKNYQSFKGVSGATLKFKINKLLINISHCFLNIFFNYSKKLPEFQNI